jgi:hypothetical protein
MKNTKIVAPLVIFFFMAIGATNSTAQTKPTQKAALNKSAIHSRKDFDEYLSKFNSRDYQGFLDYFADQFEMIHVGGNLKSREAVLKFYRFLHSYIKESVMVDRLVMDQDMIAMEARVQIQGIKELTPAAVAASDYPRLKPLKVGQTAIIPQFIHYHLVNGKIVKVECRE